MTRTPTIRIPSGRQLAGWVCLVAAFLLWSPLWATAWESGGANCCAGATCPTHQHMKHSQDYPGPATSSKTSMICEHHGDATVAPCAMSCCQTEARFFAASILFLLPQTIALWGSPRSVRALNFGSERALLPSIGPPDQPPRSHPA